MKGFNILLVVLVLFSACKQQEKSAKNVDEMQKNTAYESYGEKLSTSGIEKPEKVLASYRALGASDTLKTKFSARVKEVCQVKGCWMKLELPDGAETMVKFKDYGFFVPTDIVGKEVVVNGNAFLEVVSVDDQKHYAQDAGKSEKEIAAITEEIRNYGFEADGVLLKQ
ncbi:DUF4920 domain-containing protein [Poritiphilus flavus]|uniref:DUF4920 domain-containing protein n=1 Tax=Poritiphilus flavus TaxID=2697053 RepID=A0A6L9E8T6_9FLAO|nr:DUF4920 domain-containing protein [Poritiphilus flavus]NAS11197.1 DUF4920 domain-containing protein [Poritiphilus flavus]